MTPREAATIIGVQPSRVRTLVRAGVLPAKKKKNPLDPKGHLYDLEEKAVYHYRDHRPSPGPKPRSKK
jgi:hypothetical protein